MTGKLGCLLGLTVALCGAAPAPAPDGDTAMALSAEREVAHQLAAQVADLSAQSLLMSQKINDLLAKLAKAQPGPPTDKAAP